MGLSVCVCVCMCVMRMCVFITRFALALVLSFPYPLLTKSLQESIFRVLFAVLSAVLHLGSVACVRWRCVTAVVHVKQHIAIAARLLVSIVLCLLLGVDV